MRPRRRHVAIEDGRESENSAKPKTCKTYEKPLFLKGPGLLGRAKLGPRWVKMRSSWAKMA